ncbi:hypothetical protein OG909_03375 [Streptomyces sp. NBC_01754]|nr:hypothetical protein [Streptomyces sp. NBC_01754]WSC91416.1 hypothetical protein OG909_03375 [Streptomyces sp. NBC_01754]
MCLTAVAVAAAGGRCHGQRGHDQVRVRVLVGSHRVAEQVLLAVTG